MSPEERAAAVIADQHTIVATERPCRLEVALRASVASPRRVGVGPLGFPVGAVLAARERVGMGTALAMLEVRRAAARFVGIDAAREAVNTIATIVVLEPGADVRELALSSLQRLQRDDIEGGSPRIAADADVEACADAMADAWTGVPRDERVGATWGDEASRAAGRTR